MTGASYDAARDASGGVLPFHGWGEASKPLRVHPLSPIRSQWRSRLPTRPITVQDEATRTVASMGWSDFGEWGTIIAWIPRKLFTATPTS